MPSPQPFLSRFVNRPCALRPDVLGALVDRLRSAATAPVVGPANPFNGRPLARQMQILRNVAVIPVRGLLARDMSEDEVMFAWFFGEEVTDYAWIEQMLDQAEGDPNVDFIVLDCATPGGDAIGNEECAARIRRCTKPTVAWTGTQCCSAGYFLMSQCRDVVVAPSSCVGNVGCYTVNVDTSAMCAALGVQVQVFRSGEFKGAGIRGTSLTEEQGSHIQREVDLYGARFRAAVLSARPGIDPANLAGQWFLGVECVQLGLADATAGNLAELLALAFSVSGLA